MTETARPNFLQAFFKIRPGEGLVVGLMFLYSLLAVGGSYIIGRTVGRSLFLSLLPPEAIPYRFLGIAVGMVLVASLYRRFVSHYRRDHLIVGSYALMGAGALVFRMLLDSPFGGSFALLGGMYVYFQVVASLVIIQFWTFAGEILDPREAKRLFALIAAGGVTANVLGGATVRVATPVIGTENLIFLMVLCLAGCIACVWVLGHRLQEVQASASPRKPDPKQRASLFEDVRTLRRLPLLQSITAIIAITILVYSIADYQFDLSLKLAFGDNESQMSVYLGSFYFWGGIAACVVQFFLVRLILERFGVVGALLMFPGAVALGSVFILISAAALMAVTLTRLADVVFRYTINDTTLNLLYLPVPGDSRARAKALIDGILKPVTVAGAGLLFLVLRGVEGMTVAAWSVPVVALVVVWGVLIIRTKPQYKAALSANLKSRRLDLGAETMDVSDETTVGVLISTLGHPDELQVMHALKVIEGAPKVDWDPYVAPLLAHPLPEVQAEAIRRLGRPGNVDYLQPISALWDAPDTLVRAAAIEAYCAINGPQAIPHVIPFLEDPDPTIKGSAVIGLIRYGGLEGILHAAVQLKGMLDSDRAAMRQEGARVLGALQVPSFYHQLIPLLDDPDTEVQNGAIHTAGELRSPELLTLLLEKLEQPATRGAAAEAFVRYGPGVEPVLEEALADPHRAQSGRAQLPGILRKIETPQAAGILLARWQEPDETIRTSVFRALAKLRTRIEFQVDTETIREAITAEAYESYALCVLHEDLGSEGRGLLLDDTLQVRRGRAIERILYLLSLLYPDEARTIESARWALEAGDRKARPYAIELLDNLVERDIKELLVPLVDMPLVEVLQTALRRFELERRSQTERLEELGRSPDAWLRACAIYRIGELGLSELAASIQDALECDQALVRETALGAGRHVLPSEQFEEMLERQATDAPFPQVRNHARELRAAEGKEL